MGFPFGADEDAAAVVGDEQHRNPVFDGPPANKCLHALGGGGFSEPCQIAQIGDKPGTISGHIPYNFF